MNDFFSIDLSCINAGLTHQSANLLHIINYCYINNLKLIKPIFRLTGVHNNNQELYTDLSEYLDLNNILVNNKPYILYDKEHFNGFTIIKKKYECGLLDTDELFKNMKNCNIEIPYKYDIIETAKLVTSLIGNDFMCIHVRRGDRVSTLQIDMDTRPDNILKKIEEQDIQNVYIMTNKIDEVIEIKENKKYNILFCCDFEVLRSIKDNYYLFCIENIIMKNAKIKCSTFKNENSNYYNCNLTDVIGWQ
jgi:hypothetical protein